MTEAREQASPVESAPAALSQTHTVLQVLLIVVGAAVSVWALHRLAAVALVLILAALFAYVIAPLVQLAERPIRIAGRPRRVSRAAAIAVVYVLLAGSASAGAALLWPSATAQVDEITARAPAYAQSILAWEHGWSRYYERLRIPIELRKRIDESVLAADDAAIEYARVSLMELVGTLSYLPWLLLIPILAFFLLKDATSVRRTIVKALPHHGRLRGHRLFEELHATLVAYIRAQLLACVLVGTICGVGFAVLGIPYAVLLGVLAAVLEFIPLVGPLLLATVAAIVGALHAPILALWAVGFLGVVRLIEDYVIYPRLIRRGMHLHPLAVIVAILVGAELDGVAGMFLAVPAAATASVVYRHWLEWRGRDDAPASALVHAPAEVAPRDTSHLTAAPGAAVPFGTA
jgi:predicted PurR-regulated permease PerM